LQLGSAVKIPPPTSYYISVGLNEATPKKEWNAEIAASTNENGEAYLS